ncbi:target of EGR1 protein 1-like [Limulus polyphemus]|uniref:Target of EGR1 protein 1-like n=1 Tax=Limulus polyphemus TaxID=6850 RepID=A0ABM1BJ13_LIMPO|nr:target of EGR1 protein 1-like [Limulus polyphemus]
MAFFKSVPIVEVNKENFVQLWPTLLLSIKNSYFVAIDLELSGLGNRKNLNARCIEDRYKAIAEAVSSRAIISLGLSCFRLSTNDDTSKNQEHCNGEECSKNNFEKSFRFLVQTFNILVLCSEDYTVEPDSLKFLVDHGFDFNRQYSLGLPYYRGDDKPGTSKELSLRELFSELVRSNRPVVLHNGLVDLVFLYHSFYCAVPANISTFIANVAEIFPEGVYDTKYITDFHARLPASYLEYIFRKRQRDNIDKMESGKPYVDLEFLEYKNLPLCVEYRDCQVFLRGKEIENKSKVCKNFASHGWCSQGQNCPDSHNIDDILDAEGKKSKKNKKRRRKRNGENKSPSLKTSTSITMDTDVHEGNDKEMKDTINTPILDTELEKPLLKTTGIHRAGFDSFMTGFTLATYLLSYMSKMSSDSILCATRVGVEDLVNKIYLTGKDMPLNIVPSNFAKVSVSHREKLSSVMGKE